jgi:hypothetical protein
MLFLISRAHAQVPNELVEQARAVMAQYARDAAEVLPCAYMAGLGEPSGKITDEWGEPDVRRGLDQFAKNYGGASPAQIDTLSKTFAGYCSLIPTTKIMVSFRPLLNPSTPTPCLQSSTAGS